MKNESSKTLRKREKRVEILKDLVFDLGGTVCVLGIIVGMMFILL